MKPFVSSYAAASPVEPWDRAAEADLFAGLSRLDLAGLELPFTGRLHRHDDEWLIGQLRPEWRFVLTLLPGTMDRLQEDRDFGLASADKDGRARALDFAQTACRSIEGLPVAAVELHSAPRLGGTGAKSSLEAFADSLSQLRRMDWGGAELLVEHCDAAVPGQPAEKGFLSLEDECAAIKLSSGPTPMRVTINWARSAIEKRSADGPLDHIRRAKQAGLLGGLFFSGCTREHADYGAWKDSHAPFSASCPSSLLTPEAAKASLQEAGEVDYLGVKIQPLPVSLGAGERLAMIRAALGAISASAAC
ncbi:MAG: hypothetical protein A2V88_11650 [Elusimicrobia bacterium RBG_16_66_12]|nr:MAG: hypothetical protein A2V88_11650 [Elusimicrobia bacterium RBG_16_66_12]